MEDIAEKASQDLEQTKEDLLERWDGSPHLIAEDIFRVRSLETGEMVDLDMFEPYQPQLVNAYFYGDEKMINVYKGRRIGVSFIFCVCMLLDGYANADTFFPIVTDTQTQSENRIADIQELIDSAKIDIETQKENQSEIVLGNGATFAAFSGKPDSSRGDDSAKTVFVDEMAFLEDQKKTMQAYMPFIALGGRAKMLQVSTPNRANDLFLSNHEEGSPAGENGIIAIQQPTFEDPDSIDVNESLFNQDVTPVRHDLDLRAVEIERAQDPKGFAQEYLCKPIAEEYRFFSTETINTAMERGVDGFREPAPGKTVVMGVDIGISSDDTAVSVFEHDGERRNQIYKEIITDRKLSEVGINPPKRKNPSSVAKRLSQIHRKTGADYVILDKTGPGEGFQSEVESRIGRGAHGFNFSDLEAVSEMMGDLNYALHKELITLFDDGRLHDELSSMVKKKTKEHQKPKFSGKKHSESGKDDLAFATALAAYPPDISTSSSKRAHSPDDNVSRSGDASASVDGASHYTGAKSVSSKSSKPSSDYGNSTGRRKYSLRNSR